MTPYYQDDAVTIYHGDCREILPTLRPPLVVDLVITDPPYPDHHQNRYVQTGIEYLAEMDCTQYIFWSASTDFPLTYTGIHIWDKRIGIGRQYERIFERRGSAEFAVFRISMINSAVTACFVHDEWTGHPSQKPTDLLRVLMGRQPARMVVDPFMGSGSTLKAAKDTGRRAIGIEIEERYCEIAAKRCAQEVLDFAPPRPQER